MPSQMPRSKEEEKMKTDPYKEEQDKALEAQSSRVSALQRFLDRRLKKTDTPKESIGEEKANEEKALAQNEEREETPSVAKDPESYLQQSEEEAGDSVIAALTKAGLSLTEAEEIWEIAKRRKNVAETPFAPVRVRENGITASAGITLRPDVSRLTPKERANIALRAANGEKIVL